MHTSQESFPRPTNTTIVSAKYLLVNCLHTRCRNLTYLFLTSSIVVYPMSAQPSTQVPTKSPHPEPSYVEAHITDIMSVLGTPEYTPFRT